MEAGLNLNSSNDQLVRKWGKLQEEIVKLCKPGGPEAKEISKETILKMMA
jgi:hypothetical protein